jgi:peptidoglycan hydrolase CwlO-like protein
MERAIIDLEEQYHNTVKRIDDVEWKIESTQTYKNNKCESVSKLLTECDNLNNSFKLFSKEIYEQDIILDEKRSKLRNAYQNYAVCMEALSSNLKKYSKSPKSC